MRLVTFEVQTQVGRFRRLGAVLQDYLVDLNFACAYILSAQGHSQPYRLADITVPVGMPALIEMGASALDAATQALRFVSGLTQPVSLPGLAANVLPT